MLGRTLSHFVNPVTIMSKTLSFSKALSSLTSSPNGAACDDTIDRSVFAIVGGQDEFLAHIDAIPGLKMKYRNAVLCVLDPEGPSDLVKLREWFARGINVACGEMASVEKAAACAESIATCTSPAVNCSLCPPGTTVPSATYYLHYPLFHGPNATSRVHTIRCPVCNARLSLPLSKHVRNRHAPPELREPPTPQWPAFTFLIAARPDLAPSADPSSTTADAAAGSHGDVVALLPGATTYRYAVQLDKGDLFEDGVTRFWVPGGRVDAGEGGAAAAAREAAEEAGIIAPAQYLVWIRRDVSCLLRTSYFSYVDPPASAASDAATATASGAPCSLYCKSVPDGESAAAVYASADQIRSLPRNMIRGVGLEPALWHAEGRLSGLPMSHPAVIALESHMQRESSGEYGPICDLRGLSAEAIRSLAADPQTGIGSQTIVLRSLAAAGLLVQDDLGLA